MNKLKTIILSAFLLLIPLSCFAQIELDNKFKPDYAPTVLISDKTKDNPANFGTAVLQTIAGGLLYLAAPVAVIIIAIAGLIYTVSHGDQAMMDKAKNTLFRAIMGLLIIIFSWIIIRAVVDLMLATDTGDATPPAAEEQATGDGG